MRLALPRGLAAVALAGLALLGLGLAGAVVLGGAGVLSEDPEPTATPDGLATDTTRAPDGGAGATGTTAGTATPTATRGTATATPMGTRTPTPATSTPPPIATGGLVVTVVEVVDGDTVDIRYDNGTTDTVRLLGVDTPEVYVENDPAEFEGVPDSEAGRDCLHAEGENASAYLTDRIEGEQVRLQFDDEADRRGSFGRLLAYIVEGGENVNYRLVSQGYARVYDSTFTRENSFYSAEQAARNGQVGLWRCTELGTATEAPADTSTPSATPGGDGALRVQTVHEDAEGNDNENLDDEYVVFENAGEETLDMGGWRVEDDASHTYTFPTGFTLDPGETVTLYTGSGTDSDSELYWGSESAIWNNGGDTVFVYTASGDLVVEYTYS
jgi:micrococcal nuclease